MRTPRILDVFGGCNGRKKLNAGFLKEFSFIRGFNVQYRSRISILVNQILGTFFLLGAATFFAFFVRNAYCMGELQRFSLTKRNCLVHGQLSDFGFSRKRRTPAYEGTDGKIALIAFQRV